MSTPAGRQAPTGPTGPTGSTGSTGPTGSAATTSAPDAGSAAAGTPAPSGGAPATTGGGSAPAAAGTVTSPPTQRSSTPRLLRLARGLATAAALLTGVVATGTFDTSGVNSTPNVVAQQWVAAEEARVEIARADLVAAQAVAEAAAGETPTPDLQAPLAAAAQAHARSGGSGAREAQAAADLVSTGLLTRDALDAAAQDADAAAQTYGEASALARDAGVVAGDTASQRARDLQTGSRSALTATVGILSTLLLGGILVWLALRTRRILNVPLVVATAITFGLAYVSLNPSAVPMSVDQRVDRGAAAASALQDVREARQAEYAAVLGLEDPPLEQRAREATASVRGSGLPGRVQDAWQEVAAGHADVLAADGPAAGLEAVRATQGSYDEVEELLQEALDDRLESAGGSIGTPATVTSGIALLLGLVAAGSAWTGLTRRLRDYR